jgi:hypothetical protein
MCWVPLSLCRYGNVSSSSIWYVLAYIETFRGVAAGDRVWQLGFGSGFKCNSAVWQANRWAGFVFARMCVVRREELELGSTCQSAFRTAYGFLQHLGLLAFAKRSSRSLCYATSIGCRRLHPLTTACMYVYLCVSRDVVLTLSNNPSC